MRLNLNGNPKDIENAQTVEQLVAQLCKNPKHIIAEINGAIVPSSDWPKTALKENDAVELVAFVGGG